MFFENKWEKAVKHPGRIGVIVFDGMEHNGECVARAARRLHVGPLFLLRSPCRGTRLGRACGMFDACSGVLFI